MRLAGFLILFLGAILVWALPSGSAEVPMTDIETEVLASCNDFRATQGLKALLPSNRLAIAARGHSDEMMKEGYFSHTSPNETYRTLKLRLRSADCCQLTFGENLYKCKGYARKDVVRTAVTSWINSQVHRKNLVNVKFNEMGVGVAVSADTYIFTQVFSYDTVEILAKQIDSRLNGYHAKIKFRVIEGPRSGAILFQGRRIANWAAAADGTFDFEGDVSEPGTLDVGQAVAEGEWAIETEVEVPGALFTTSAAK